MKKMSLVKKALSWDADKYSCTVVHPIAIFLFYSISLQLYVINTCMLSGVKEEIFKETVLILKNQSLHVEKYVKSVLRSCRLSEWTRFWFNSSFYNFQFWHNAFNFPYLSLWIHVSTKKKVSLIKDFRHTAFINCIKQRWTKCCEKINFPIGIPMEAQGWTTEGCSENNFLEMKSTELWNFFLFN